MNDIDVLIELVEKGGQQSLRELEERLDGRSAVPDRERVFQSLLAIVKRDGSDGIRSSVAWLLTSPGLRLRDDERARADVRAALRGTTDQVVRTAIQGALRKCGESDGEIDAVFREALRSGSPRERAIAAIELGNRLNTAPSVIETLRETILAGPGENDDDLFGQAGLAYSHLTRFCFPQIEFFRRLLENPAPAVRRLGVLCLSSADITPEGIQALAFAVDDLVRVLADSDADTRRWAAETLARVAPERRDLLAPVFLAALDATEPHERHRAAAELLRIDAEVDRALAVVRSAIEDALRDDLSPRQSSRSIDNVISALGRCRFDPVPDHLLEEVRPALESPHWRVRVHAAGIISRREPENPAVLAAFLGGLRDPNQCEFYEHHEACLACEGIERLAVAGVRVTEAVPGLMALARERTSAQYAALSALRRIGPDARQAIPLMVEGLRRQEEWLRSSSFEGLWEIDPEGSIALAEVERLLESDRASDRAQAVRFLGRLCERGHRWLSRLVRVVVEDPDDVVRAHAAVMLRRHGAGAVAPLREALGRVGGADRVRVVNALAAIGEPARDALPDLLRLIADSDDRLVDATLAALATIAPGDRHVLKALRRAARSPRREVRFGGATALAVADRLDRNDAPLLEEMLEDPAPGRWVLAAAALAEVDAENGKAAQRLREALALDHPQLRFMAAAALGTNLRLSQEAVPALLEALDMFEGKFRARVLDAIAEFQGDPTLLVARVEAATIDRDESVRHAAERALERLQGGG